jgi:tetratricopeptide (TPR) repeat protein
MEKNKILLVAAFCALVNIGFNSAVLPAFALSAEVADDKTKAGENASDNADQASPPAADKNLSTKADTQKKTDGKKPYLAEAVKHYNRAVELHQSGYLNPAVAEYKAAIDADDRMEEAYSNLGLIYAAQRSYNKAIEAFQKALSLKPSRPTTLNGLGSVLYSKGKIDEAKEKWRQAIDVDPKFASAYFNLGNAYESEKDSKNALSCYFNAIKSDPAMADAYYRMGTILLKEHHQAQAQVLLSKAVDLSPNADYVKDARRDLSVLRSQLQDQEEDKEVEMNVVPPAAHD